ARRPPEPPRRAGHPRLRRSRRASRRASLRSVPPGAPPATRGAGTPRESATAPRPDRARRPAADRPRFGRSAQELLRQDLLRVLRKAREELLPAPVRFESEPLELRLQRRE